MEISLIIGCFNQGSRIRKLGLPLAHFTKINEYAESFMTDLWIWNQIRFNEALSDEDVFRQTVHGDILYLGASELLTIHVSDPRIYRHRNAIRDPS